MQRVVVMRLGCEMDHRIMLRHQFIDQDVVADIPLDQREPLGIQPFERRTVGRIGHLVEYRDFGVGVRNHVVHEVRPNESRSPSYKDSFHSTNVGSTRTGAEAT